jgi:hypothetical protein
MATDFNKNIAEVPYGLRPKFTVPIDGRTVVETFSDISSIPNPFLGMQVFVKDSNELYLVKKIDERIDEEGSSEYFINTTDEPALARMVNSDNIDSIVGPIEGVAYLTSYVFTRATSKPGKPNGGRFTKPYPMIESDGETIKDPNWHDTVPSTGVGAIYMSYCTFCSDPSKDGE